MKKKSRRRHGLKSLGRQCLHTVLVQEERKLKEEEDKKEQAKFSEGLRSLRLPSQPACSLREQLRDSRNVLRKSRRSSAAKRRGTDS